MDITGRNLKQGLARVSRFLILAIPSLLLVVNCGGGGGRGSQTEDPLVEGSPMAYVKRTIPENDPLDDADAYDAFLLNDAREPAAYYPGGDLYMRDHISSRADEREITASFTKGLGDVKDVEVSYDGTKLLFAMRAGDLADTDPEDQPTWNIWEYNISTDSLRRLISSDIRAEEGQDISPAYLPDGRIIFTSTRQKRAKAILVDEGKPRFAATLENNRDVHVFNIHIMDPDGSNIRQLTFGQTHDLDPMVHTSGKIIFTRWIRLDNEGNYESNFFSMHPDGTNVQQMFGSNSHNIGSDASEVQFLKPKEFTDGRILTILKPNTGNFGAGNLVLFDIDNFTDISQPVRGGVSGTGMTAATNMNVRTDAVPTLGGRFAAAAPLWDGSARTLVSWNQCRLMEGDRVVLCTEERLASPTVVEAPPIYSIYMYDHGEQTLLPVILPAENIFYSELVVIQDRSGEDKRPKTIYDATTAEDTPGVLHIRSVYDIDGTFHNRGAGGVSSLAQMSDPVATPASDRPARFLRILKSVTVPDRNITLMNLGDRFRNGNRPYGIEEIVGYAPIEPDGSVKVRVPANVPLTFHILDGNGYRINDSDDTVPRTSHPNYWLTVRPGETMECAGCHDSTNPVPHGRIDAVTSINLGAPADGLFPNTDSAMAAMPGETMAETRTRLSCVTDCAALNPTMGLVFEDTWAEMKEDSFSYSYENVYPIPANKPVSQDCASNTRWNPLCRVVFNYGDHIHPLWTKSRGMDADGVDMTCASAGCHSTRDAMGELTLPKPAIIPAYSPADPDNPIEVPIRMRQLNLTDESADDPAPDGSRQCRSYKELTRGDNLQFIVRDADMNPIALDDVIFLREVTDPDTMEISFESSTRSVGRPISLGFAVNSNSFFAPFRAGYGGDNPHFDSTGMSWLSPAEQKVIAEWIDTGTHYTNNLFATFVPFSGCLGM